MLVPTIVNVLDDKSFELLIVTSEFKKGSLDAPALLDKAPSIEKLPELPMFHYQLNHHYRFL